jgi:hypothetical protein
MVNNVYSHPIIFSSVIQMGTSSAYERRMQLEALGYPQTILERAIVEGEGRPRSIAKYLIAMSESWDCVCNAKPEISYSVPLPFRFTLRGLHASFDVPGMFSLGILRNSAPIIQNADPCVLRKVVLEELFERGDMLTVQGRYSGHTPAGYCPGTEVSVGFALSGTAYTEEDDATNTEKGDSHVDKK